MKEIQLSNDPQPALVDDKDYENLLNISKKWYFSCNYIVCWLSNPKRKIFMHKIVAGRMGLNVSKITDHINFNTHDNQSNNLREATDSENSMHRRTRSDSKLGLKCIYFNEREQKYKVRVRMKGADVFSGTFKKEDLDKAIIARDKAIEKYHGDFGCTE